MLMKDLITKVVEDPGGLEKFREGVDVGLRSKLIRGLFTFYKNSREASPGKVVIVPYRDAEGKVRIFPLMREQFMREFHPAYDVELERCEKGGLDALEVGAKLLRSHEGLRSLFAEWNLRTLLGAVLPEPLEIPEAEIARAVTIQFSDAVKKDTGETTGTLDQMVSTAVHRERALKKAYYYAGIYGRIGCRPEAIRQVREAMEGEDRSPVLVRSSLAENRADLMIEMMIAFRGELLLLDAHDLLTGDIPTAMELRMRRAVFITDIWSGELDEYGEEMLEEVLDSGIRVIMLPAFPEEKLRFESARLTKVFEGAKMIWLDEEETGEEDEEDETPV